MEEKATPPPESIPYGQLKKRHAEYDAQYWAELRALYRGGKSIFGNQAILRVLFPMHNGEDSEVYQERCKRAHYENHAGTVVGHIADGLFQDPAHLRDETGEPMKGDAGDYYSDLWKDCSAPGGRVTDFNQTLKEQVLEAFQVGTAWSLLDLPNPGADAQPTTLADEEKLGVRDPYIVPICAEEVVNWRVSSNDDLAWALMLRSERVLNNIGDDGSLIRELYTLYTPTHWAKYEVIYTDPEAVKSGKHRGEVVPQPADEVQIKVLDSAPHPFTRVPLRRLSFQPHLWALDRMDRTVRAAFNMASALDWAIQRANFPQLYEFLAPEMPGLTTPVSEAGSDPNRAVRQKRGVGYVQERGHEDRAEYLAPPTDAFAFTQERLGQLRKEIYDVVMLMALSEKETGSAIRRSAESKAQDKSAMMVILHNLGQRCREHANDLLTLVQMARGEEPNLQVCGFEKFDPIIVNDAIEMGLQVNLLSIPSVTFHRIHKQGLAKRIAGADATPAQLKQIEAEIESNVTEESVLPEEPLTDDEEAGPPKKGGKVPPKAEKKEKPPAKA